LDSEAVTQAAGATRLDSQVIEVLGRNRLVDEILRAGLEVALPVRDRGLDLIAYADIDQRITAFVGCPIQMKAASTQMFSLNAKYARIPGLLIAYIWHVDDPRKEVTYVMTYAEAFAVAEGMGWTLTASWKGGSYTTTRPSKRLQKMLELHRMTPEKWWEKVVGSGRVLAGGTRAPVASDSPPAPPAVE
jgi:hypothetical protein